LTSSSSEEDYEDDTSLPKRELVTITVSIVFAVVITSGAIVIFLVLKRESVVKFFASMEKFNHSSLTKSASEVFPKKTFAPNGNLNKGYNTEENQVSSHYNLSNNNEYEKNKANVTLLKETNHINMNSINQDNSKNKKKYTQDELDRIIYAQTPVFTVEENDDSLEDENNDVFYNKNDDKQTSF
jgi:hypothetical protein